MKNFILLILPCLIAPSMGFAQIELKSDDQTTVISFGTNDETSSVQIGKAENSGSLLLQGSEGFRFISGNQVQPEVISYDIQKPDVVTFNTCVSALGLLAKTPSGEAQHVENPADLLSAMPLRYENEGTVHYFLEAEGLASCFPELVVTSEDGSQCIDYVGVVTLLVGAVQELNSELAALKGETNGTDIIIPAKAALQQNQPNPAKNSTVIKYTLPEGCVDASVCIFDLQGSLAKTLNLDASSGSSQITVSTSDIQPGMYLYSLVVDGNVAATKKMIVTR